MGQRGKGEEQRAKSNGSDVLCASEVLGKGQLGRGQAEIVVLKLKVPSAPPPDVAKKPV